jgi:hypothetical protein
MTESKIQEFARFGAEARQVHGGNGGRKRCARPSATGCDRTGPANVPALTRSNTTGWGRPVHSSPVSVDLEEPAPPPRRLRRSPPYRRLQRLRRIGVRPRHPTPGSDSRWRTREGRGGRHAVGVRAPALGGQRDGSGFVGAAHPNEITTMDRRRFRQMTPRLCPLDVLATVRSEQHDGRSDDACARSIHQTGASRHGALPRRQPLTRPVLLRSNLETQAPGAIRRGVRQVASNQ